jgi:hypothetical protein
LRIKKCVCNRILWVILALLDPARDLIDCGFEAFFYIFFVRPECVGHSFAYVAQFVFLRDVWTRTQRAAVASRSATNLATHLPSFETLPFLFRKYEYDSLKIEHHAHGAKTSDPVINKENDCRRATENKRPDNGFLFPNISNRKII